MHETYRNSEVSAISLSRRQSDAISALPTMCVNDSWPQNTGLTSPHKSSEVEGSDRQEGNVSYWPVMLSGGLNQMETTQSTWVYRYAIQLNIVNIILALI
jgi:hypothetical protein